MDCKHLKDVDMSYFEHLAHAWSMAAVLIVHGLIPWIFKDYASNKMKAAKEKSCNS